MTELLAGSSSTSNTVDNLIAGSKQPDTKPGVLITGQNLARGAVIGRITASNKLTLCDLGAADGSQKAIGILVHTTDASAADKQCQYYTGGTFRDSEMTWHASFDSQAKKNIAFDGTPITIRY